MALQSLLDDSVTNRALVLIRDSVECPSRHLVAHIVNTWITRHQGHIIVAQTEDLPTKYTSKIAGAFATGSKERKQVLVDFVSDPHGWNSQPARAGVPAHKSADTPSVETDTSISSATVESRVFLDAANLSAPNSRTVVCTKTTDFHEVNSAFHKVKEVVPSGHLLIDSLSGLISPTVTAHNLARLLVDLNPTLNSGADTARPKPDYSMVFAVVHEDLHDQVILATLERSASAIIQMTKPPAAPSRSIHGSYTVIQKRKSGKAARVKEHFALEAGSLQFKVYSDLEVQQKPEEKQDKPTNTVVIHKDLDSLTEEQRQAKDAVFLPYMKMQEYPDADTTSRGGAIYLDQDDDAFAGSDPDDDLDF